MISEKLGHEKRVILDVKTRWCSLYEMLKVVYEISEPLQTVLGEVRPELIFTMKELEKIELLENVLRPVSKGSATLGSDFATLMSAESCHKYMIKKLQKIDNPIAYEIKDQDQE